jgi:hypothetical protein
MVVFQVLLARHSRSKFRSSPENTWN